MVRDQRRALVDHAVVDAPRRLVAIVVRLEKQAAETGRKLVEAIEKCSYRHEDHPFRLSDGKSRQVVQNAN